MNDALSIDSARSRRQPRRALFRRGACLACGLVLWGYALTSCSRQPAAEVTNRKSANNAPVPVLVARAETRDVPVEIQNIGSVQAYSLVSMRPQVTGPITAVHIREGQEVRTGDLLFTLDPRPFEAALNEARANLARDEAQLINARLNFERTSNLFNSKISSEQDYEAARATFLAAEATVMADGAAITNAQVSLDYTLIRSPIDGRTGALNVKVGNVVKSPDDVLMTITQIRPIYVAFSLPEPQLPVLRQRAIESTLPVKASLPGATNLAAFGELTLIDNRVDTNTGTILLKGTFPNTNDLLWPGQFVQVSLTLSNLAQVTVVPSQAVQTGQDGEFIFVVKPDASVEARPVTTGITMDGVTVIAKGVNPNETVVTDGQMRLVPGSKVSVKTQLSPGSP